MGFGDVELAVLLGLLLGFPHVLLALFLAFLFGAIIGAMLMFIGRKGLKSQMPFGPFLIAAWLVATMWGAHLIGWYLQLFTFS